MPPVRLLRHRPAASVTKGKLRMKKKENSDAYKQQVRAEENLNKGLLNFVVVLAVAAVAYTDSVVVANVSLGYLYVLPIALSALVNPLWVTVALAFASTALQD